MSLQIFGDDPFDPKPRSNRTHRQVNPEPPFQFQSTEEFLAWDFGPDMGFLDGETEQTHPITEEVKKRIMGQGLS